LTRRIIPVLTFAMLFALPAAWALDCGDRYEVVGKVVQPGGQLVVAARVHVLLDQVSKKKFLEQGVRGRSADTDGFGRFQIGFDCEVHRRAEGPNPCAKKIRDVTVMVGHSGMNLTMHSYKLKKLKIAKRSGVCFVEIPDVVLKYSP